MKKIFVFALWGDSSTYWIGSKKNIDLIRKYYPGWICRFYIDENCDVNLIDSIQGDNVEKILMSTPGHIYSPENYRFDHPGLFWRFIPLGESDVEIVISRDSDSRISEREFSAIDQWLKSKKDFHIMRDHPYHRVPILAGMWGARNGILKDIKKFIKDWQKYTKKGIYQAEDQDFLGQIIYPIVKNNSYEHSEFGINYGNVTYSFPTIRKDYEFVGDVFDTNDERHPEYWKIIKQILK